MEGLAGELVGAGAYIKIAAGYRIGEKREIVRAKRVNRIIELRYNDMFFRQMQDEALTRYSQAFDLAQKYVYMAAQVYDYETGLLSGECCP